ncbi:hypothetical protein AQUCO_12300016v1 [Aquilegia coerulea]|uniref:Uncharacterized protein n=2 Tax=Aquilegia coerulea TaxID=218851 RepID=A0A2G5C1M4_AQUCA|nr:hypothetical protein AQUCO_12300016v1 [Aquilegia coerulea]
MLGRVRASPSSLESLELERPSSKLIKGDALSIYEATLEKLRLGSRRALRSSSVETMQIDAPTSSASASPSSSDRHFQSDKNSNKEMEDSCCSSVKMCGFARMGN